jgi:hypothetical protein
MDAEVSKRAELGSEAREEMGDNFRTLGELLETLVNDLGRSVAGVEEKKKTPGTAEAATRGKLALRASGENRASLTSRPPKDDTTPAKPEPGRNLIIAARHRRLQRATGA